MSCWSSSFRISLGSMRTFLPLVHLRVNFSSRKIANLDSFFFRRIFSWWFLLLSSTAHTRTCGRTPTNPGHTSLCLYSSSSFTNHGGRSSEGTPTKDSRNPCKHRPLRLRKGPSSTKPPSNFPSHIYDRAHRTNRTEQNPLQRRSDDQRFSISVDRWEIVWLCSLSQRSTNFCSLLWKAFPLSNMP